MLRQGAEMSGLMSPGRIAIPLPLVFIKVFGTYLEGRTLVTLFRAQDFNQSTTVHQICDLSQEA